MALKQMLWLLLRWVLLILALAIMPGTASAQATCDPDAPLIQASIADAGAPRGEYVNYSYYQAANTVSSDGRVVAFETFFGEQSTVYFYVYERDTCTLTTLVEIPLDSYYPRSGPSISHDGRYVVFSTSQTDLVNNDTNGKADVFLKDLQLGTITRISLSLNGQQLSVDSFQAIMAGGGRYVVYISDYDLMRYDRQTNTRELLLAAPDERDISPLDITPDGRFVVFASHSDNIVPDDTNNREDIFVYNQQTAEVTRVSIGSNNTQGNDTAYDASISANGRYVAFSSSASNLVPGDKHLTSDVFLHDRETGQTIAVSVDSEGTPVGGSIAEISEDGRYIAFSSSSEALLPGKPLYQSEVFIRDMITGALSWISNSPSGEWPNGYSDAFSFSEDGKYLVFISRANNLVPGDDDALCSYDSFPGIPDSPCDDLFLKRLPVFTVISTSDITDGFCDAAHCSLREAIIAANAAQQPSVINFNIAGAGVRIIQPSSALPTITVPLTINGASQPGYSGTPLIQLDGSLAGANANGLTITAANSIINDLIITRFSGHGIALSGAGNSRIERNTVGTNGAGATNLGNGRAGIAVLSGVGNLIRGNHIFGNGSLGIDIGGDGVTANDLGDFDAGANLRQNYPELTSVTFANGLTTLTGNISTAANMPLIIDVFQTAVCDSSGFGEGMTALGEIIITTNSNGLVDFTFQFVGQQSGYLTTTVTDSDNNTSEFSGCISADGAIAPMPDTPLRNLFTSSTPTLTWATVRFAALYEIQVDDNEDFSSPEYANAAIPSTQLQVMTSALVDGLYYWRVRAINGNGLTGLWSAVDTFVVDVP